MIHIITHKSASLPAVIANPIIPFSAVVDADVRNVYWFLNETFLGKGSREQTFMWEAKPGNYVVRVVDDYGAQMHVI